MRLKIAKHIINTYEVVKPKNNISMFFKRLNEISIKDEFAADALLTALLDKISKGFHTFLPTTLVEQSKTPLFKALVSSDSVFLLL